MLGKYMDEVMWVLVTLFMSMAEMTQGKKHLRNDGLKKKCNRG